MVMVEILYLLSRGGILRVEPVNNLVQDGRAGLAGIPGGKQAGMVGGDYQTVVVGEDFAFETLLGPPGEMVGAVDEEDVEFFFQNRADVGPGGTQVQGDKEFLRAKT